MSKSRKLRCLAAFVLIFALVHPMAWAASGRSEEGLGSAFGWLDSLWRGVLEKAGCVIDPQTQCGPASSRDHGCGIDPWGQEPCGIEPTTKHGLCIDPWGRCTP